MYIHNIDSFCNVYEFNWKLRREYISQICGFALIVLKCFFNKYLTIVFEKYKLHIYNVKTTEAICKTYTETFLN